MSTNLNESGEGSSESGGKSNDSGCKSEKSPLKKLNRDASTNHAKPKRRRRGRGRKHRKSGGEPCGGDVSEECGAECENHGDSWESEEEEIFSSSISSVVIRPTEVPQAPRNSTQFIIDDHEECGLYKSFENNLSYGNEQEIVEPEGEDAAYVDINYQYVSDCDHDLFFDREFEISYSNCRFDKLNQMSRTDLIHGIEDMEKNLADLSNDIAKENPESVLDKLQRELLELQEQNSVIKNDREELIAALPEEHYQRIEEMHATEQSDSEMNNAAIPDHHKQLEEVLDDSQEAEKSSDEHVDIRLDVSNKENNCCDECTHSKSATCKNMCHKGTVESCLSVKEQGILRDSEYNDSCEDMPLNSVSEDNEFNTVTV